VLHELRLIRDQVHADPDRKARLDPSHAGLQRVAEPEEVGARAHGDGEADRRLAVHAEQRRRRILVAPADLRDVGQAEEAVIDPQVDILQRGLGRERPAHPDRDALRTRLHDAGSRDRVLRLKRLDERLEVDAVTGELAGGEVEIDRLGLRPDQLGLADVRDTQDVGAHLLDVVPQLPVVETVGREGVDVAVDVAELVVEERSLNTVRELSLDVAEALAHLVERRLHLVLLQRIAKLHEHRRRTRRRVAADVIEPVELLQLLLDPIGDLVERVLDRRAGPGGLHDHRLDREGRVLLAAEPRVRHHAGDQRHQHQEPDERAVRERPVREIE
jgi:hypothetical protein